MEKVNISEILSHYHLVVPEIQRDYVWGKHPEVLAQFIGDLNKKLGEGQRSNANIGFLYSYPVDNENYIIDGQQRLTTILLLLHYLSVQNPIHNACFKKIILPDETTLAFEYRVRPTSLSFMKMLFRNSVTESKSIRNLKDYKLCYDNDLTVVSCLSTLDWFYSNLSQYPFINFNAVLERVEFWYFGVDKTSQGEELYITMNSRGERLTESEHIKPRLFDKLDEEPDKQRYGKSWDDWEEFLYSHRDCRSIESIDTAMNNIIRIVIELKTCDLLKSGLHAKHAEYISLDDISSYMSALIGIYEISNEENNKAEGICISREISRLYEEDQEKTEFADGDFNVLKALLTEYIRPVKTSFHNLEQVYHTVRNLIVRGILKSSKDFLVFLSDMKKADTSFYDFMLCCPENEQWHSIISGKQEPIKIKIFKTKGKPAERQIWNAQETHLWKGDIKPLLYWSMKEDMSVDADNYSVIEFDRMRNLLNKFFDENKNEGLVSDETRRALLTYDMPAYPWWKSDNQAYFGHTADEWHKIILKNSDEIRIFLNAYSESGQSPMEFCKSRIKECPTDKDWSEFVRYPYLLKYLNTKHVTYTADRGLFLEKGCYAQQISVNDEHLYQIIKKKENDLLTLKYRVSKDHWSNDNWVLVTDDIVRVGIWYGQIINSEKELTEQYYVVRLQKRDCKSPDENRNSLKCATDEFEFTLPQNGQSLKFVWDEEAHYYMLKVPFLKKHDFSGTSAIILKLLEQLFTSSASLNGWE